VSFVLDAPRRVVDNRLRVIGATAIGRRRRGGDDARSDERTLAGTGVVLHGRWTRCRARCRLRLDPAAGAATVPTQVAPAHQHRDAGRSQRVAPATGSEYLIRDLDWDKRVTPSCAQAACATSLPACGTQDLNLRPLGYERPDSRPTRDGRSLSCPGTRGVHPTRVSSHPRLRRHARLGHECGHSFGYAGSSAGPVAGTVCGRPGPPVSAGLGRGRVATGSGDGDGLGYLGHVALLDVDQHQGGHHGDDAEDRGHHETLARAVRLHGVEGV
jgi:hypothetical protein